MRVFPIFALFSALALSLSAPQAMAQDDPLIPPKRMAITQDVDLPGNDLRQIFDIGMDACLNNCRADSACAAVTYNAQSSACFPKSAASTPQIFQGAFSAVMIEAGADAQTLARSRAEAAPFLDRRLLQAAQEQAADMQDFMTGGLDGATLASFARDAIGSGDFAQGQRLLGAAIALDDRAEDWGGYAELFLATGSDRRSAGRAGCRDQRLSARGG